jgi:phospholipase C
MHRVSIHVHSQQKKQCVNILSNIVFIVLLFQENKSFGASYHLHSSSDVREAVSGTTKLQSQMSLQILNTKFKIT